MTFEEQAQPLARPAIAFANKIVNDWEDSRDIVQQAMLKAFLNFSKFRQDSKFSTWFFQIVKREALMFLRRKNGPTRFHVAIPIEETRNTPSPANQEQKVINRDLLSKLLPRNKNSASLILRTVYGLADTERPGLKRNTVKGRVFRATETARERMKSL